MAGCDLRDHVHAALRCGDFGVCGVVIIGAAVAAGAAGAAVTYGLQSGSKSVEGMAQAVGWGAVGGLGGVGAGFVISKIVGAVASKVVSGVGAQAASKATTGAAKAGSEVGHTVLYQKLGTAGEHLKYGITKDPATRYTSSELDGGG